MGYDATKQETIGSFVEYAGIDLAKVWWKNASWQEMVRWSHKKYNHTIDKRDLSWRDYVRRLDLIDEEYSELSVEMSRIKPDPVRVVHEATDVLITVLGLFVEMGVDADACVRDVMRANMTKTYGGEPNVKPVKGPDFVPADLSPHIPSGGGTDG